MCKDEIAEDVFSKEIKLLEGETSYLLRESHKRDYIQRKMEKIKQ